MYCDGGCSSGEETGAVEGRETRAQFHDGQPAVKTGE